MAEVPAATTEEHFDVLTKTGEKTGVSKPRHVSRLGTHISFNWGEFVFAGELFIGMEITTGQFMFGFLLKAHSSFFSKSAQTLARITQGDLTVTAYFNALKGIWLDLDTFHDYEWESTRDANHYRSMVNKDQVFKFLSGLNDDLDEVRGRIIAQKPLPKLGEAFSEVRREETRRRLMLGKKSAPLVAEGSALQVATQVIKPATETIPEALAARRGNFQKPEGDPKAHLKRKTAPSTTVPDIQHTDDQPHSPVLAALLYAFHPRVLLSRLPQSD
ncbi:hypothetical protein LINPERHAP1_LOCUS27141 [Linum perenne]